MSDIVRLAEAVAAELAEYHAEVLFCPEFKLRDIDEMRVAVVPLAVEYKTVSRASREECASRTSRAQGGSGPEAQGGGTGGISRRHGRRKRRMGRLWRGE